MKHTLLLLLSTIITLTGCGDDTCRTVCLEADDYYADRDSDEFGDPNDPFTCEHDACATHRFVANGDDCNDDDPEIGAERSPEVLDNLDNDCDGMILCRIDGDRDGFSAEASIPYSKEGCPEKTFPEPQDCDDTNRDLHPDQKEICDGLDNDCDGQIDYDDGDLTPDENTPLWFEDLDDDGHGDPTRTHPVCDPSVGPPGHAPLGDDCDEADPTIHPTAAELCNGLDDDCDGLADNQDPDVTPQPEQARTWFVDADGDGAGATPFPACDSLVGPPGTVAVGGDCDETDPAIHPGAAERCDGVDNDCDAGIDLADPGYAGPRATWYPDGDGDGHGALPGVETCDGAPAGHVAVGGDCDEGDPSRHPGAAESCVEPAVDRDCDGLLPAEDPDAPDRVAWYPDLDGDGDGATTPTFTCGAAPAPTGWATRGLDCDDSAYAIHPGAVESCDTPTLDLDCDGLPAQREPAAWVDLYPDRDGDGAGDDSAAPRRGCPDPAADPPLVEDRSDCDDADVSAHPHASEACDDPNADRDCDGLPGAIDPDGLRGLSLRYPDADRDGEGNQLAAPELRCAADGSVLTNRDCDDAQAAVSPGAPEVCNERDDDCDGEIDVADVDYVGVRYTWYIDDDADGAGAPDTGLARCSRPPVGTWSLDPIDCDDADPDVYRGAPESCAAPTEDRNCDGVLAQDQPDLMGDRALYYPDLDGDSFGDAMAGGTLTCPGPGLSLRDTDCDDADAATYLGAVESCEAPEADRDCDGVIGADQPERMPGAAFLYPDTDRDGEGDAAAAGAWACPGLGRSTTHDDCDDRAAVIRPGAPELCNERDDDCDGLIDAADPDYTGPIGTWYADADRDGAGAPGTSVRACAAPTDGAWVTANTDCDDADASVRPGAPESCADLDADRSCDGVPGRDQLVQVADAAPRYADADADGFGAGPATLACPADGLTEVGGDCDDSAAEVRPGATEVCNDRDDDCDALVDLADGLTPITWHADADGDGYGDPGAASVVCDPAFTPGYVADATDCDDRNNATNPGAVELCNGDDDDCSGVPDDVGTDGPAWYADLDDDGFGAGPAVHQCTQPAGHESAAGDCDDSSNLILPGAIERCDEVDNDCDGLTDNDDDDVLTPPTPGGLTRWWPDGDNDGHAPGTGAPLLACAGPAAPAGYAAPPTVPDCDDTNPAVHPNAAELCDDAEVDENCDGLINSQDPRIPLDPFTAGASTLWYPDADNDGAGDAAGALYACADAPPGHVAMADDCDDADAGVRPGAPETCAEPAVDHDCDGRPAFAVPGLLVDAVDVYPDVDSDGYGADVAATLGCVMDGWSTQAGDCDDRDAELRPGAPELCNGADDDCDLLVDDADPGLALPGSVPAWRDIDRDSFGDAAAPRSFCAVIAAGWVDDATDCDDGAAGVHPGATEVCNERDDNCDALIDEADPGVVLTAWYADGDRDGFGGGVPVYSCPQPAGRSTDNTDCDDTRSRVYPDAPERCDGLDNDCDGPVDNADADSPPIGGTKLWNADLDGDGFGDPADGQLLACTEATPPPGYAASDDDCDNGDPAIRPGAQEVCNAGVDDDCDGLADSADDDVLGDPSATVLWYADADADGFGSSVVGVTACADPPAGYAARPANLVFDCDDGDPASYPGAPELCDDVDQDCDGGRTWDLETVAFHPISGSPVDLTDCLTGATDVAGLCTAGDLDLVTPGEGTLHLCQRAAGPYRLRIQTSAPLEVIGHHEDDGAVVLTNKEANGARHDWVIQATSELTLQDLVIRDSGHKDVDQARAAVDHNVTVARALTILRCEFIDNGAGSGAALVTSGGGAVWSYGTPVQIEDSTFSGNNGVDSPVKVWPEIRSIAISSVTVRRSTFTENTSPSGNGGAIHTFGPSVVMEDVDFNYNSGAGAAGGAAYLSHGVDGFYPSFTLRDVHFDHNAALRGGALFALAPTIELTGTDAPSTFTNNSISGDYGGAVYLSGQDIDITNVVLSDNRGSSGSGMTVHALNGAAATLDIDRAVFSRNHAPSNAALFLYNQPITTTISNSTFSDNTALLTSALYAYTTTTLRDTTFLRNNSSSITNSGAISFQSTDHLRLERVDLADNIGGAMVTLSSSDVTLTDSTLTRNSSSKNAALYVTSGNSNQRQGTLTVTDTTFADNHNTNPTLRGGAVYLEPHTVSTATPSLRATFERTLFDGNTSQLTGGAIAVWGNAALTLDDTDFVDNDGRGRGSAVSLEYNPSTGDPTLSIAPTCDFDDGTPDDLWTSGAGAIDYANQTSCTAQTGCTP